MSNLNITRGSYTTVAFTVQQKETPSSAIAAMNLSGTTAFFHATSLFSKADLIQKSSTATDEIAFVDGGSGGKCEVYITEADTNGLTPLQDYFYHLEVSNTALQTFIVKSDTFTLKN